MIKCAKVAKFVDNNIVGKMRWEQCHPVIEIEITKPGSTPPPRALISNRNSAVGKSIRTIKKCETLFNMESQCLFLYRGGQNTEP